MTLADVPHRTTVESMARELGVISELQAAEAILANENCTLGFDATTQEGVHINSIHFTTQSECYAIAVDELAGGTAQDYHQHICNAVNNLADTYANFHQVEYQSTRKKLVDNFTNTLTDRCAANHAAIELLKGSWNKTLNELNCHLHPLDSFSIKTKAVLKKQEKELNLQSGKLFGKECIGANLVLNVSKLRYKDGKGDPRGFTIFLASEGLPRGLIPRYRGNRLHVLFHTAGVLIHHYQAFCRLLSEGTPCGGLRKCLHEDFQTTHGHVELQVLGLIGKLLTGPWMSTFYTSAEDQISHVQGIAVVKEIVASLQKATPLQLLSQTEDFFGNKLHHPTADPVLKSLTEPPRDQAMFESMMKACLQEIVDVLKRQYSKYFECNLSEVLQKETETARTHNIDAEEVMGMFSALKKKAPSATICYLSCKMRAKKNKTVEYLDKLDEGKRKVILKKAVQLGQKQRRKRKAEQNDLRAELLKRQTEKQQAREATERRKVERKLKNTGLDRLVQEFAEIGKERLEQLVELMEGKAAGKDLCHVWLEDGKQVVYSGKIEKLKKDGKTYVVGYWGLEESVEDATDYNMSMYELGADLIAEDLVIN